MKKDVRGAKSVAAQSVHNQLVTPHYNNKQYKGFIWRTSKICGSSKCG